MTTTIDQHREALRASGLTDDQIDAALDHMDARAQAPYVDPHDLSPEPAQAPPTWTCEIPPGAFLGSLNGYDEIAITGRFGASILALRDDPIAGGRALAFIHQRRLGKNDPDAFTASMDLTMSQVMAYFAPEPKDDDDPASAEGNAPSA